LIAEACRAGKLTPPLAAERMVRLSTRMGFRAEVLA
jgi:hypothetical protein